VPLSHRRHGHIFFRYRPIPRYTLSDGLRYYLLLLISNWSVSSCLVLILLYQATSSGVTSTASFLVIISLTRHLFSLDSGRVSIILTMSPSAHMFSSS